MSANDDSHDPEVQERKGGSSFPEVQGKERKFISAQGKISGATGATPTERFPGSVELFASTTELSIDCFVVFVNVQVFIHGSDRFKISVLILVIVLSKKKKHVESTSFSF